MQETHKHEGSQENENSIGQPNIFLRYWKQSFPVPKTWRIPTHLRHSSKWRWCVAAWEKYFVYNLEGKCEGSLPRPGTGLKHFFAHVHCSLYWPTCRKCELTNGCIGTLGVIQWMCPGSIITCLANIRHAVHYHDTRQHNRCQALWENILWSAASELHSRHHLGPSHSLSGGMWHVATFPYFRFFTCRVSRRGFLFEYKANSFAVPSMLHRQLWATKLNYKNVCKQEGRS